MDSERWVAVRAVFEALVDLPESERTARLARLERDDPELAAAVAQLLAADLGSDTLQLAPDAHLKQQALSAGSSDPLCDSTLGDWRLLRALGEGGMGAVYLAERENQGVRQRAAVKVLRSGYRGVEARRRFLAEQRMLAALHHANIAHLIEGGISADGMPYLALEYVDGVDLLQHVRQRGLDVQARVHLFLEVCAAVEHAHQQLIVHRDLKPGNILVTADGSVKLLDFGIGKLLGELDPAGSAQTVTGMRLFTLGYGAPEQLRGEPVSTATDVYALGVVLYKLLTDRLPFEVSSNSVVDWERVVLTQEPTPPSRRVPPSTGLVTLASALPRMGPRSWHADMDAIVMKALRREPAQRYASVAAFRDDLLALLAQRPVSARRGSRRYRVAKFVRRNALALALVCLAAIALLAGTAVALWQARQARMERAQAQESSRRAEATVDFLTKVFANADPGHADGADPTARALLAAGEAELGQSSDLDPATRTSLTIAMARAHAGLGDFATGLKLMLDVQDAARSSGSTRVQIDAAVQLGIAYNNTGQRDLALAQYQTAETLLHASGSDEPLLQARLDQLIGTELNNLDRPAQALERVAHAHRVLLAARGPASQEVADCLDVYLVLLKQQGQQAGAVAVTAPSAQAVADGVAMPTKRRALILAAHAYALNLAGRFAEAEPAIREAVALNEALYGPDNLEVGFSLSKLMLILANGGKFDEALAVGERFLAIRRRVSPPPSARYSATLASVAFVAIKAQRWEQAQALIDEAVAGFTTLAAPPTASSLRAELLQAQVWLARGQQQAGEQALQRIAPLIGKLSVDDQALARRLLREIGQDP